MASASVTASATATATATSTSQSTVSPSPTLTLASANGAPLLLKASAVPNPQSGAKTTLAFKFEGQITELTLRLYTKAMIQVAAVKAQDQWFGPAWAMASFETPGLSRGFYWFKLSASGPAGTCELEKIGTLYRLE